MLGFLHTKIGDTAVWKDLLWLGFLLPVLGLAAFIIAVTFWATALGMIFLPAWYWSIPDGVEYGLLTVDKIHEAFAVVPVGLVLFALTVPLTRGTRPRHGLPRPARCSPRASAAASPSSSARAPAPSTPRPPSCSASSATSTTARRRGSSRSRWTSAWRRRRWPATPRARRR